jgi:hypothetical protein
MANDVHRIVQNSTHRDQRSAVVLVEPKQNEMSPATAIAAEVKRIEAGPDFWSRAHPENLGSFTQRIQGRIDLTEISVRLRNAEATDRPAIDFADIGLGGP